MSLNKGDRVLVEVEIAGSEEEFGMVLIDIGPRLYGWVSYTAPFIPAERVRLALDYVDKLKRAQRENDNEPDWEDVNEAWRRCDEASDALDAYDAEHPTEPAS